MVGGRWVGVCWTGACLDDAGPTRAEAAGGWGGVGGDGWWLVGWLVFLCCGDEWALCYCYYYVSTEYPLLY